MENTKVLNKDKYSKLYKRNGSISNIDEECQI